MKIYYHIYEILRMKTRELLFKRDCNTKPYKPFFIIVNLQFVSPKLDFEDGCHNSQLYEPP